MARAQSSWRLIRRLLVEYVRPYRQEIALTILAMIAVAATTALQAWLIQPALDLVLIAGDRRMLFLVPGAILAVALIKSVATYYQSTLLSRAGHQIIARLQGDLFAHLMRADLAFFHGRPTGSLIANLTNDTQFLRNALNRSLIGMARDVLLILGLLANMVYQSWELSLAAIVTFPLSVYPIVMIGRRMRKTASQSQEQMGSFAAMLAEGFAGVRHVKAYGQEERESGRARTLVGRLFAINFKSERVRARSAPIMDMLGACAVAVAIFYGGTLVQSQSMTAGQFMSFLASLLLAYQPVRSLAALNAALQEGLAGAERLFALVDLEPTILDAKDAKPLAVAGGAIRLHEVSFAYAGKEEAGALHRVTLKVPAGRRVALVGPSGAGKSTILNLLLRFFEPQQGRIEIDGQDITRVTLASLRGHIGLVSQEVGLFDGTVRFNIAYGKPEASEAEIRAAAIAAEADAFIQALPQGYDTRIGEAGVTLSGGQRQRLAIARAMLKNAPILLLDEATSALDLETERQVQQALDRLMKGRTTIIVAHRLSTIADADLIHVLEAGRLVESGTHATLLARRGLYARLYASQRDDQAEPLARASPMSLA